MPEPKPPVRGKTSPYGFFVKMCYEEHKKKFPDESTMKEEEKKRFFELADKDAQRYQAEVQAYGGEDTSKKKKRQKKDPNAPKKKLYRLSFFFSNEKRPGVQQEHPDWKVGQIAQELGKHWKTLSDEERAVYERKAAADKIRYDEEMRNYRASNNGNNTVPMI
ncbi:HMG box domain-containing protein [Aphelenchoides besseyi]|nr:HMG box domain-containing protein [Aphelenchoides besseyi]